MLKRLLQRLTGSQPTPQEAWLAVAEAKKEALRLLNIAVDAHVAVGSEPHPANTEAWAAWRERKMLEYKTLHVDYSAAKREVERLEKIAYEMEDVTGIVPNHRPKQQPARSSFSGVTVDVTESLV